MKINVKKIQCFQYQYKDLKSDLIKGIFKDIFNCDMNQSDIQFEYNQEQNCLCIKKDISQHGSPCYKVVSEIIDKNKIDLYFSLKNVFENLKIYQKNNN